MFSTLLCTLQPELMFLKAIEFEHICAQGISQVSPLSMVPQVQVFTGLQCFLEMNSSFYPASSARPARKALNLKHVSQSVSGTSVFVWGLSPILRSQALPRILPCLMGTPQTRLDGKKTGWGTDRAVETTSARLCKHGQGLQRAEL